MNSEIHILNAEGEGITEEAEYIYNTCIYLKIHTDTRGEGVTEEQEYTYTTETILHTHTNEGNTHT